MSKDYQRQFDEAYEVLEIAESDGFKTLMADVEQQITSLDSQIETAQRDMLKGVRDEGIDAYSFIQKLVYLNAKREGLKFISTRIDTFRKRRDEASNKLES